MCVYALLNEIHPACGLVHIYVVRSDHVVVIGTCGEQEYGLSQYVDGTCICVNDKNALYQPLLINYRYATQCMR